MVFFFSDKPKEYHSMVTKLYHINCKILFSLFFIQYIIETKFLSYSENS